MDAIIRPDLVAGSLPLEVVVPRSGGSVACQPGVRSGSGGMHLLMSDIR
jgi:hypothetical protein